MERARSGMNLKKLISANRIFMKTPSSKQLVLLLLTTCVFFSSCSDETKESGKSGAGSRKDSAAGQQLAGRDSVQKKADTAALAVQPVRQTVKGDGAFYLIRMKDSGKAIIKSLSPEMRTVVYKLNRRDAANMGGADSIIIPKTGSPEELGAYSPFPAELPELAEVKKIVFFSYPVQAFGAYEYGKLVRWGPTSMGKKSTPTPTGLFFANWKAKETISTVNDEWKLKWNFNISNKGGVGWHQYAMPGYPASHSCLRLFTDDAQWLYDWAEQWKLADASTVKAYGTPTIVYGAYGWGQLRPWMHLLEAGDANNISIETLQKEYGPRLSEILEKQRAREAAMAATSSDSTRITTQ